MEYKISNKDALFSSILRTDTYPFFNKVKTIPQIVYHDRCIDGYTSLLLAWAALRGVVSIHPGRHGVEDFIPQEDGAVIFVDFCYPLEEMRRIAEKVRVLVVVDHHASTVGIMEYLDASKVVIGRMHNGVPVGSTTGPETASFHMWSPGVYSYLDMDMCGAALTLRFFNDLHPSDSPVVARINSRDMWKQPGDIGYVAGADFFHYFLMTTLDTERRKGGIERMLRWYGSFFSQVKEEGLTGIDKAVDKGRKIKDFIDLICAEVLRDQISIIVQHDESRYNIPAVQIPSTTMSSDILHHLILERPEAPFVIGYRDTLVNGALKVLISLRSTSDEALADHPLNDVSMIARSFGGGGHRHAAGFMMRSPPHWQRVKTGLDPLNVRLRTGAEIE